MKNKDFNDLLEDFMFQVGDRNAETSAFIAGMAFSHASMGDRQIIWRECLRFAVHMMEGGSSYKILGRQPRSFADEIYICKVFIRARESLLSRQGKESVLERVEPMSISFKVGNYYE